MSLIFDGPSKLEEVLDAGFNGPAASCRAD